MLRSRAGIYDCNCYLSLKYICWFQRLLHDVRLNPYKFFAYELPRKNMKKISNIQSLLRFQWCHFKITFYLGMASLKHAVKTIWIIKNQSPYFYRTKYVLEYLPEYLLSPRSFHIASFIVADCTNGT